MNQGQAILDAICEQPDDALHRFAYADWLDDHGNTDRADFIRLQLRLQQLPPDDPTWVTVEDEADDLLARHEEEWLGPVRDLAMEWQWRGGFVEQVTVDVDALLSQGDRLLATGPIRELRPLFAVEDLRPLAQWAGLERFEKLDLGRSAGARFNPAYLAENLLQSLLRSPHLTRLTWLSLAGHGISTTGIRTLHETSLLGRLTHLDLRGAHTLGDAAARFLAETRNERLLYLNLQGSNMTGQGTRSFLRTAMGYPRLNTLLLDLNRVFTLPGSVSQHIDELLALPGARQWQAISLHLFDLSNPQPLGRIVEGLPSLRQLDLAGCGLGHTGAAFLANLPGLSNIRHLRLENNNLRDRGVRALAESPYLGPVHTLTLGDNQTGGPGLRALASSGKLADVHTLDLSGNFVGTAGLEALFSAPDLGRLTSLSLQSTNIDPEATRLLVNFGGFSRLRTLNLNSNRLGDLGVGILADSPNMRRLRDLNLNGNGIDSPGAMALIDSPHLSRVVRLSLRNALITHTEREQIIARFGPATDV